MWNYKIANEFIGADGVSSGYIQDTKTRNIESTFLPSSIGGPQNQNIPPTGGKPDACPTCKSKLHPFEFQGRHLEDGSEVYKCKNCGYTNDPYKRRVTKNKSRIRHRRKSNLDLNLMKVSSPATNPGQTGYNNTANQPSGRLDLSQDERVIPWDRIKDSFEEEYDQQKQKNRKDFKIIRVRDKNGKLKHIKVINKKEPIQPSNTFTERGRLKKQPRYNPQESKNKHKSDGSWPHNRNPGTEGYYQQYSTDNQDADMRYRQNSWQNHVGDQFNHMLSISKPW